MATLITVLKSGGRYDATWVRRLAAGLRRSAPAFDRILCLTDLPLDVAGVETVALRHGWPGWWSKLEAFRPGLGTGTAVPCDLDTVFSADPARWMEPGSCGPVPNAVHDDQVVIDHLLHRAGVRPDFFQSRHPGLLDVYDPAGMHRRGRTQTSRLVRRGARRASIARPAGQGDRLKALALVFDGLSRRRPPPRAQAFASRDVFPDGCPEKPAPRGALRAAKPLTRRRAIALGRRVRRAGRRDAKVR